MSKQSDDPKGLWRARAGSVVQSVQLPPMLPLKAGHVDQPKPGELGDTLSFVGWAVEESSPIDSIEVVAGEEVVTRVAAGTPRPDIARAFPTVPRADESGFRFEIPAYSITHVEQLEVKAGAADGVRVPMWTIRLQWGKSPEVAEPWSADGAAEASPAPRRHWFRRQR